jgi:hypothetical protein
MKEDKDAIRRMSEELGMAVGSWSLFLFLWRFYSDVLIPVLFVYFVYVLFATLFIGAGWLKGWFGLARSGTGLGFGFFAWCMFLLAVSTASTTAIFWSTVRVAASVYEHVA